MAKGRTDLNEFFSQLLAEQDGDVLPEGIRVLARALRDGVVGWGGGSRVRASCAESRRARQMSTRARSCVLYTLSTGLAVGQIPTS